MQPVEDIPHPPLILNTPIFMVPMECGNSLHPPCFNPYSMGNPIPSRHHYSIVSKDQHAPLHPRHALRGSQFGTSQGALRGAWCVDDGTMVEQTPVEHGKIPGKIHGKYP